MAENRSSTNERIAKLKQMDKKAESKGAEEGAAGRRRRTARPHRRRSSELSKSAKRASCAVKASATPALPRRWGIAEMTAWQLVRDGIASAVGPELRERERALALDRFDRLQSAIYPKAARG